MAYLNVRTQQRRDTAANWTQANPVLASGELGLETDTNKLKAGDGSTSWVSLPYLTGAADPGGGGGLDITGSSGETIIWENGAWATGPYIGGAATTYDSNIYDPYWDQVIWLYDFTGGTNGSTDFTTTEKKGEMPFTLTAPGSAAFSTTQVKWGTTSVYLNNTYVQGNSNCIETNISRPGSTLDGWVWVTSAATSFSFAGYSNALNGAYWWYQGGKLEFYWSNTVVISQTYTFPREQWVYVACVLYESGNEAAIYVNGARVGYWNGTKAVSNQNAGTGVVYIGSSGLGYSMKGYIAEMRFTRAARYSGATGAVPTSKFPQQGVPTVDTRYVLEHHEDVDTPSSTLVNGSSLVYLSAEDKWISGPPVGRVEPVGDPLWSKVKKYLPFDQTPLNTNYGSDTTTALSGTNFSATNAYLKGYSPVGGRGCLNGDHDSVGSGWIEYTNFPFVSNQNWCIDYWFRISSAFTGFYTQDIPFIELANPADSTSNALWQLLGKKSNGTYHFMTYTNDINYTYQENSKNSTPIPYNYIPLDQWVHLACVYSYAKNNVRVYINGKENKYVNLNLFPNADLDGTRRLRIFQSSTAYNANNCGISDIRITTDTLRFFNPSNPDDQSYKFTPLISRPLQASTGEYQYVKDTSAEYIKYNTPPTSATSTGKLGDIRFDTTYMYICTAPNTWKRVTMASW